MASAFERITCVQGDITRERVDAIVNAANEALRGGAGVDGAIHAAAGPELLAACLELHPGGCPTGEARLTPGFRLAARHVIHTVGPVWRGGTQGEERLLAACYGAALDLAAEHGLTTLAFPAISCGVYGYPHERAAPVALSALGRGLVRRPSIEAVRVVLFGPQLFALFRNVHASMSAQGA